MGFRETFLSFQGGFLKMYRIYRKIPDPFQGDFEFCSKNRYILEEFHSILWLISWSLPDDEGDITCLQQENVFLKHYAPNWYVTLKM